jgi:hypothetical protein
MSNDQIAPEKPAAPESDDPLDRIPVSVPLRWVKEYRFIIIGLFAAIIGAATAFFATKTSLGLQIDELRIRLTRNESLRDELGTKTLHLQMSNLRLLEDEIKRIERFKNEWKKPTFAYKRVNTRDAYEVAEPTSDEPILSFDLGLFGNLATVNETRAIRDTELTATLVQILNVITEYNQGFQNSGPPIFFQQPVPSMGGIRLQLRFPLSKSQAERFLENSSRCIAELDGLLKSGVAGRLKNSREEIHKILSTYEGKK